MQQLVLGQPPICRPGQELFNANTLGVFAIDGGIVRAFVLGCLLVLHLSLCATGERVRSFQPGMTRNDVTDILGNPDGYQISGEYEALKYVNRLISGWSWDRTDNTVILKGGHVVEFGPGQVRQRDPNVTTLILVPLR